MLKTRKTVYKTILVLVVLQLRMLQSFCSAKNSYDSWDGSEFQNIGGWTNQTTTESSQSLNFRLFGISYESQEESIKTPTRTTKPSLRTMETTSRQDSAPRTNISHHFYYKENVVGYPDLSKLEHLLKRFEYLFDVNELDTKTLLVPEPEKYKHLCGNEKLNIPLAQEVLNSKDEKVFLVNSDKYAQSIIGEVCGEFEDSNCQNYLKHFHEGYEPMCKQNYIFRKMVVVKKNPENLGEDIVAEDEIPIPVCCECVLKDKSLM